MTSIGGKQKFGRGVGPKYACSDVRRAEGEVDIYASREIHFGGCYARGYRVGGHPALFSFVPIEAFALVTIPRLPFVFHGVSNLVWNERSWGEQGEK